MKRSRPQAKSSAALVDRGSTVVPSCRMARAAGRYSLIATSRPSSESPRTVSDAETTLPQNRDDVIPAHDLAWSQRDEVRVRASRPDIAAISDIAANTNPLPAKRVPWYYAWRKSAAARSLFYLNPLARRYGYSQVCRMNTGANQSRVFAGGAPAE